MTRGPPVGDGKLGDAAPDPLGDLVGLHPVGAREDRRELVAAIAIERVAGAGRRPASRRRRPTRSASPAGWPHVSLNALERVEVEHEERERRALAVDDRLAQLALERAVVAEPRQGVVLGPDA